jgi:nicotinamide-nucleotide amidase
MYRAHIITIGNEILIGDTINTNASWIGSRLTEFGFQVERVEAIPDSFQMIKDAIHSSMENAELTIVTGGLGPTHDDITKRAVADLFESDMSMDQEVLEHIKTIFETRGFHFSEANREQALVPKRAEVLFNNKGTAPGLWFHKNGHALALLPGVPHEMKFLMNRRVAEKVSNLYPEARKVFTEYYRTASIPESTLSEKLGELDPFTSNGVDIAFLPSPKGVTVRISAESDRRLEKLRNLLYKNVGDYIYGVGKNLTLSEVLVHQLAEKGLTISAAESCTGGYCANLITNTPGSSQVLIGGIVAYHNRMKVEKLGVNEETLDREGAVSKKIALQMAKGVADFCGTDIGVSTTGIAGPGGGTEEKPVGTVWMGFWIAGDHFALKTVFTKDRLLNKTRTGMVVLDCIRRKISGVEGYPYELKPHYP